MSIKYEKEIIFYMQNGTKQSNQKSGYYVYCDFEGYGEHDFYGPYETEEEAKQKNQNRLVKIFDPYKRKFIEGHICECCIDSYQKEVQNFDENIEDLFEDYYIHTLKKDVADNPEASKTLEQGIQLIKQALFKGHNDRWLELEKQLKEKNYYKK